MVEENTIDKSRNIHTWGEFSEIIKGNGVQKVDFVDEGYGCIHYGQIYTHYGPYTYNTNKFVSKEIFDKAKKASKGDIIMTDTSENVEDICKSVAYLGNDDIAVSNHALIIKHNQNPKFLSYSTLTDSFFNQKRKVVVGVKVSGIKPEQLAKIKIYLPSLSEQQRIVDILDTFTSSIDNLKQQISQRRKQYEYYRDQLLDLEGKEGVEMKKIGDLFVFKNGLNKEKKYFGEGTPIVNYTDVYHNKCLNSSLLNGRVTLSENEIERFRVHKGDVFFTRTSETPEEVGYTAVMLEEVESCTFSGFLLRARPITNLLLPEFCAYCFGSFNVRQAIIKYSTFTTRALTNGPSLSKISVPVPSLSEQQRIVDILDKFEASIQNLESQLSQREKQYEYYRNKLLTFED